MNKEAMQLAMKLALEALELVIADVKTTPSAYEAQRQAITALREALAEQSAQQEPAGVLQEIARLHDRIKDLERDVEFLSLPAQRTWQDLPDMEIIECAVHARFEYDPPYVDKNGVKHLAAYEIQLGPTYKAIAEKLKQKNGYTEVGYGIKEKT